MTVLALLLAASLFLAFSNGANDNFKGFATVWGSAALSWRAALALATAATLAGGAASLFIAEALAQQFSGKGLVSDALAASPPFALAVAAGAGATVLLATRLGFPVSTTHALVGALIGAGLAGGEPVNFARLSSSFVLPLLASPFVAAALGFLAYRALRRTAVRNEACVCLVADESELAGGAAIAAAAALSPRLVAASASVCDAAPRTLLRVSAARLLDGLHVLSAGAICFARAVNDAPKIAPLLVAAGAVGPRAAAIAATLAMALGGLLLSRRVAETISLRINRLDPAQGAAANLITAGLVLAASRYGLPVSTTHVAVGSIGGAGAAAGTLDVKTLRAVLLSWILTLPIAAVCAFALARAI